MLCAVHFMFYLFAVNTYRQSYDKIIKIYIAISMSVLAKPAFNVVDPMHPLKSPGNVVWVLIADSIPIRNSLPNSFKDKCPVHLELT